MGTHQIINEIDEFQHSNGAYECEENRMNYIAAEIMQPCIFIRYNPNKKNQQLEYLLERINYYMKLNIDDVKKIINEFGYFTEYINYSLPSKSKK